MSSMSNHPAPPSTPASRSVSVVSKEDIVATGSSTASRSSTASGSSISSGSSTSSGSSASSDHPKQPSHPPITHEQASQLTQRLIARFLSSAGFTDATQGSLLAFQSLLDQYTKEWAEIARRPRPSPTDLLTTLSSLGVNAQGLKHHLRKPAPKKPAKAKGSKSRSKSTPASGVLQDSASLFRQSLPSFPVTPPSTETHKPHRPAHIPSHLPEFPPSHTYQSTKVEDTSSRPMSWALEQRKRDARLVEDALRRMSTSLHPEWYGQVSSWHPSFSGPQGQKRSCDEISQSHEKPKTKAIRVDQRSDSDTVISKAEMNKDGGVDEGGEDKVKEVEIKREVEEDAKQEKKKDGTREEKVESGGKDKVEGGDRGSHQERG
ncbi:hypothetical protein BJ684DRAFT_15547 [Piptocephalis cylindrospora]|uniref:Transcription initiation factor TFIID subunit 8 n=1 Tax=Piptocephalis cylindrospora TaxID=1907219 RepID=A0A4P9Y5L4_9FUNG|nr:hypothetical protein BJ684DRAFT_15547 [Piptocephalis cylindrospora]|eukprot:RKP14114.1 hypothetical protein BJ684DRAFT_15547 [Piptocephalis cylindrospora]